MNIIDVMNLSWTNCTGQFYFWFGRKWNALQEAKMKSGDRKLQFEQDETTALTLQLWTKGLVK